MEGIDIEAVIREVRQTLGPNKKLAIYLDNASIHKTKGVLKTAKEEKIELIYNVEFRADMNGIERLWDRAKIKYKDAVDRRRVKGLFLDNLGLTEGAIDAVTDKEAKWAAQLGQISIFSA